MKKFIGQINRASGVAAEGVTVTVTDHYSGIPIDLYEEDGSTPLAAVVSDAVGRYRFKADDGLFDLVYTGAGVSGSDDAVPHANGGPLLILSCAEAGGIGYGKLCYASGTNAVKLAKNNGTEAEAAASYVCVTRGGRTSAQTGAYRGPCVVGGLTGGTAGAKAYLSTAGGVTVTLPVGPDRVAIVGQYLTTTRLDFRGA